MLLRNPHAEILARRRLKEILVTAGIGVCVGGICGFYAIPHLMTSIVRFGQGRRTLDF
jgi:hypothetical protein